MSKLPKYQLDALTVLRVRLNPDDPVNNSDEEIKAHLRAIAPWLNSWVLTAISALDSRPGRQDKWLRDCVSQDACHFRRAHAALKRQHKPGCPGDIYCKCGAE